MLTSRWWQFNSHKPFVFRFLQPSCCVIKYLQRSPSRNPFIPGSFLPKGGSGGCVDCITDILNPGHSAHYIKGLTVEFTVPRRVTVFSTRPQILCFQESAAKPNEWRNLQQQVAGSLAVPAICRQSLIFFFGHRGGEADQSRAHREP